MVKQLCLPDKGRAMGIHVVASKGAGKSRLLARTLAWLDFARGIPLVILDPNGALVDNLLDKFTRLPADIQRQTASRIRYVETAGVEGYIVPFPLYYRAGKESLYAIAQRYLEVVSALDPSLHRAPILGWNPLWRLGTNLGMLLAACGLQITEAEELLLDLGPWQQTLAGAVKSYPELCQAIEFVKRMGELRRNKPQEYNHQSDSLLTKLAMFRLDPAMRAMFGASKRGIDWNDVVAKRQAVLIDFRHEHDLSRMRFKLHWIFTDLMEFIRRRGPGRHRPVSVVVDEITYLLPSDEGDNPVLTAQMNELINRLSRNNQVWLTLAHQEMHQLGTSIQKALMTMGTQIIGSTTDPRVALTLAERFYTYDPYELKKTEPVYSQGVTIDYRTVEFTKDEQRELNSRNFLDLPRYHFLVGVSPVEGTMPTRLQPVNIEGIDAGQYVDEALVTRARRLLIPLGGRSVSEVLSEIDSRQMPETARTTRVAKLLTA